MTDRPVALITGASRGIGSGAARHFVTAGYRVALLATSVESLGETLRALGQNEQTALPIGGDLTDLEFAHNAIGRTIAKFGRIDVLVNNAATREIVSMRRISLESWENTIRVCLTAPAFLARWAAEDMRRRSSGVIINVSSVMSLQAAGISPAYLAAKGGLDALTYELASLYGPDGIRVVGIQPGAVDTEMSRGLAQGSPPDLREFGEDMIMLRRWASPDEIGRFILLIASEAASYVTGTNIEVDGGWSRQHLPLSLKKKFFTDDFT